MARNILFFDIETEVNAEALEYIPEPKAPANYKDEGKIAAYIAEKKAEITSTAALDADYGKIVAISMQVGTNVEPKAYLVGDEDMQTETDLINHFWSVYKACQGRSCGYNIIGFDLPYLLRRSFDLGIKVPVFPVLAKFRTEPTIDLMGILYNWGQAKGLKWVCKRYGIKNDLPDLDGSQVATMDRDTLRAYATNEVKLVVDLYQRMSGVYFAD